MTTPTQPRPLLRVPLDPGFVPAIRWRRDYQCAAQADRNARPFALALLRPDGTVFIRRERLLAATAANEARTLRYVERLLKFMLWQKGGNRILVAGADEVARALAAIYAPGGERAFDHEFVGGKIYGAGLTVEAVPMTRLPAPCDREVELGRHLSGCRIGFDLGGSDRKAAAVIDGRVVYSEEVPWSPYFEQDPTYHLEGVHDSLRRAAAHLPRVDAIGGSAAGVYVNNEVRAGSLFRGVGAEAFDRHIRRMFFELRDRWGGVPFEVANDGEVTALAGSMALGKNAVLGVSMGTSQAGGYVNRAGRVTSWLNELAFVPVDYRPQAPVDEWSGDAGCGVQYFSQQGVARLAAAAGFEFSPDTASPERLVAVQVAMETGDPRAAAVYETLGGYFGYAVAHYAEFYDLETVLLLGRVTSGPGGEAILGAARDVLHHEFPELAARLKLCMPDEQSKRHGQAVAAASLPSLAVPVSP